MGFQPVILRSVDQPQRQAVSEKRLAISKKVHLLRRMGFQPVTLVFLLIANH
jgi:hypothetical protein